MMTSQLKVMFEMRGKKIEYLNNELDQLKEKFEREKRIHCHEISIIKGDVFGRFHFWL